MSSEKKPAPNIPRIVPVDVMTGEPITGPLPARPIREEIDPPAVVPQRPAIPYEPQGDRELGPSSAVAAFRLGRLSVAIWSYFNLVRTHYHLGWIDTRDLFQVVPQAIGDFRESCQVLADVIPPHIYGGMDSCLGDLREIWAAIRRRVEQGEPHLGPPASPVAPWQDEWSGLRRLAGHAIPHGSPARPIYELGVAIGDYEREFSSGPCPESDQLPDPSGLIGSAARLPKALLDRSPLLQALSRLRRSRDPGVMLRFYNKHFKSRHFRNDWYMATGEVLDALHDLIEQELDRELPDQTLFQLEEGLPNCETGEDVHDVGRRCRRAGGESGYDAGRRIVHSPVEPQGPYWDKESGNFYLDGTLIATFLGRATKCRQIFDEFQDKNWPDRISDLSSDAPKCEANQLHQTVSRINKKIGIKRYFWVNTSRVFRQVARQSHGG